MAPCSVGDTIRACGGFGRELEDVDEVGDGEVEVNVREWVGVLEDLMGIVVGDRLVREDLGPVLGEVSSSNVGVGGGGTIREEDARDADGARGGREETEGTSEGGLVGGVVLRVVGIVRTRRAIVGVVNVWVVRVVEGVVRGVGGVGSEIAILECVA